MSVIAKYTYEIKPGRMRDFITKLITASSPEFVSPVMPKSARLFRRTVPGPDTREVVLLIEYDDMIAYGARSDFENNSQEWRDLFAASPDSPEQLISVELLTEFAL